MIVLLIHFYLNLSFFTKLGISCLLAIFALPNLAVKRSDVDILNSWVVVYLSWSWSIVILFSISLIFVLYSGFLTKLVTLGILFSTALRAVIVAKLVIGCFIDWNDEIF